MRIEERIFKIQLEKGIFDGAKVDFAGGLAQFDLVK